MTIIVDNFGEARLPATPEIIRRRRVGRVQSEIHDHYRHTLIDVTLAAAIPPFDTSEGRASAMAGHA